MTRKILALTVLLMIGVFAVPASQAKDVRLSITYTGTVRDTVFDMNDDGFTANFVDGQAKGTFGASMVSIFSEFELADAPIGHSCSGDFDLYAELMYAKAVTTFSNGDQLYATTNGGWLCLDLLSGNYDGEATGIFMGGTGRFADATGDFVTPFAGKNLSLLEVGFGFGSFRGVIEGTVDRH